MATRQTRQYSGEDYHSKFEPRPYLEKRFKNIHDPPHGDFFPFILQSLHEICKQIPSEAKVIDIGCGPTIYGVISASSKSSDITCAEYTERNRTELTKWLTRDKDAFDWSHTLKYVTVLEGRSESEWKTTEQRVHNAIQKVVACDVTKENILAQEEPMDGHFDLVITTLCLEAACVTYEAFNMAVSKIAALIKPGGHLIMANVLDETFYYQGEAGTSNKFFTLKLSEDMIMKSVEAAGLVIEKKIYQTNKMDSEVRKRSDFTGALVTFAKKELEMNLR